jgi:hypothetical protein
VREAYLLAKARPAIRSEIHTIVQLSPAGERPVLPQNLDGKARLATTPAAISMIRKGSPAVLGRERNSAITAALKQVNSTARIRNQISAIANATRNLFLRY